MKPEEWDGDDSHRILTLRHDESFEAQNEGEAQEKQGGKEILRDIRLQSMMSPELY